MNKKHREWLGIIKSIKKHGFGPLQEHRNLEGKLHKDNGPAYISPTTLISYQDGRRHGLCVDIWGSQTYYFNGVLIPSRYMTEPETLTFEEVVGHPNAEVRAVGIKIYGFDRMLDEERFEVVELEKDTNYMLLRFNAPEQDESFCLVRVFNSTLNPDGTRSIYYLCVPPEMTTVRQAVAWTFYKEADEYNPVHET